MPRELTSRQALAVTLGVTVGVCVGVGVESDEVLVEVVPVDADSEIDAPTVSGSLV